MHVEQNRWNGNGHWTPDKKVELDDAQLVLVFGATDVLKDPKRFEEIRAAYPKAHVCGCSTSGEIHDTHVLDDSLIVTAARFRHTDVRLAQVKLTNAAQSFDAGRKLAQLLPAD